MAEVGSAFVLKTCQRTLVVGHELPACEQLITQGEHHQGPQAYHFLLETIVGLKSQILAENEITAQFKEAYRQYIAKSERCPRLMTVLEKLFKDAKEVRTRYLLEVGQQSYAGITKRLLLGNLSETKPLVILGSGQLAFDLVKLLHKRFPLALCARNQTKLHHLKQNYRDLELCDWSQYTELWRRPVLLNTIGADETLFDSHFFHRWSAAHARDRLFIDLSSPSVIETSLTQTDGVTRLEDIFAHGVILNEEKQRKITQARQAIDQLVIKRLQTLERGPCAAGGEEYQFA